MNLKTFITRDSILPELKAGTKQGVIEEIVTLMTKAGKLNSSKEASQAVLTREAKMSTGIHNGVAIPHGKTDTVNRLVAAIGIHRTGVDFASVDGKPSHIFVLTLAPENRTGQHIQFIAEISRVLSRPELRANLLKASSSDDILKLLTA